MQHAEHLPPVAARDIDAKLKAMLCFFIDRGAENLGKTKLMKLLYFADFGFYREHGTSISGAEYRKWPQGPVPPKALDILNDLIRLEIVERREQNFGGPIRQTHVIKPDCCSEDLIDPLTDEEKGYLDSIWTKWGNVSTSVIVEASHNEVPWMAAPLWGEIPYHTAVFG